MFGHECYRLYGADNIAVIFPIPEQLEQLQTVLDNARNPRWQMEQWLKCQYLEPLVGKQFSGIVSQVNSNGYTVRLDEHNIEGFVDTRQIKQKYSFDPMRLRLKNESDIIELNKAVAITISEVNSQERSIYFLPAQPTPNQN